jgi:hypothetical protein
LDADRHEEIKIETGDILNSPVRFTNTIGKVIDFFPKKLKGADHTDAVNELLRHKIDIDTPPENFHVGRVKLWIRSYVNANEELTKEQATEMGLRRPFKHTDKHWYIFSASLRVWLQKNQNEARYKSIQAINTDLRMVGCVTVEFSNEPAGKGGAVLTLRPFKVPLAIAN